MRFRSLRKVAVALTWALLANLMGPRPPVYAKPAPEPTSDTIQPPGQAVAEPVKVSPPYRQGDFVEDVAQRTAYRKVLKNGDETRVLLSLTPWHYEISPGMWTDIDNTLVSDTGPWAHRNKGNAFVARFTDKAQGNQFRFEHNGKSVTFDLPEQAMGAATVHANVNGEKVHYESAGAPIAVDYEVASAGVMEDVWLLRKGAPAQLHFPMSLEGVTPEVQTDGSLWFVKDESVTERAFYIPAPFVEDANGANGAAAYEVQQLGQDRWQLRLSVDRDWLDQPERAWPVRIDPTLWVDSDGGQWKQVTDGSSVNDDKIMTIGFNPTRDIHLQWNLRDMGLQGQLLSKATLTLRMPVTIDSGNNLICTKCGSKWTIFQEQQEWFKQAATYTQPAWQGTSWEGGTACTAAPCTSMQVSNPKALADYSHLADGSAFAEWEYDVTAMVRTWIEGLVPNNGFYLTNLYPVDSAYPYVQFYSPAYVNGGSYLELTVTNVAPPTFQKVGPDLTDEIDVTDPTTPTVTVTSQAPLIQTQLYVDGVLAGTNTTSTPGTLPFTLDASRFPYGTHRLTARTFTGTGQMVESAAVALTFGEAGLTPPGNLVVVPRTGGGTRLTWAPSSANRPGRTVTYSIQKSGLDQYGTSVVTDLGEVAGTAFDDPADAITATTKSYSIQAIARDAATGAVTARSAVVSAGIVPPIKPTGLTYRPKGDGSALLLWDASPSSQSDQTLQYQVYQNGTLLGTTTATQYQVGTATGTTPPPPDPTPCCDPIQPPPPDPTPCCDPIQPPPSCVPLEGVPCAMSVGVEIVSDAGSTTSDAGSTTSDTGSTYWVTAVRGSGHASPPSASVIISSTPASVTTQAPPGGLEAKSEPGRAISLSWNSVAGTGITYDIARYSADDPLAMSLDSIQPSWTGKSCCSYRDTDTNLAEGQWYWYRIRSVQNGAAGPWSEPFGALASTRRRTGLDQRQAFVEAALGTHGATVSLSSGNLALTAVDSAIALPGGGQTLARIYNSRAPQTGTILGGGWRLNAEWRVERSGTNTTVVTEGDGTEHRFQWNGTAWTGEDWYYGKLQETTSGWLLTYPDYKTYAFASDGKLTSISDRYGTDALLTWSGGVLTQLYSPRTGRSIRFNYGGWPTRLTLVIDSAGRATSYQYDGQGRLATVVDNGGQTSAYRYDSRGRLTAVQDGAQRWTYVAYGANGGVSSLFDALGNGPTFRYLAGQTVVSDALGNQTTYALNTAGWLTAVTDAMQNTTTFAYVLTGTTLNTFTVTNPRGLVTEYSYDAAGQVVRVVDRAGTGAETPDLVAPGVTSREILATYNAYGDLTDQFVQVTDSLYHGSHIDYTYAGNRITATVMQRLTKTGSATPTLLGNTLGKLEQTYDAYGRPVTVKDPNGNQTLVAYNADGTLSAVTKLDIDADLRAKQAITDTTARNVEQRYIYSTPNDGRPTQVLDWNKAGTPGPATAVQYDAMGRVTLVTTPGGARTYTFYDAAGVPSLSVDAGGRITTTLYDPVGRPVAVIAPDGGTVAYQYDAAGRTVKVTDPLKHETSTQYDALNRVTRVTDANGMAKGYVYDKVGNVIGLLNGSASILDQNMGYRVSASYYLANLLRQSKEPVPASVITTATGVTLPPTDPGDPAGTTYNVTTYQYDRLGAVTLKTDANGYRTGYVYDNADLLASVTQYGVQQYPATTRADLITEYAYDPNGNRIAVKDPLQHVTQAYYDGFNRVWREVDATGAALRDYRFDNAGRLFQTMEPSSGRTSQYTYDLDNHLTAITYPRTGSNTENRARNVQYVTDAAGQRMFMWDGFGASYYSYDAMGRLQREQSPQDVVSYEYDGASNLSAMISHLGRTTYQYDSGNRPTHVVDPLGYSTDYTYNAGYGQLTSLSLPLDPKTSKLVRTDTYAALSDGRMTNRLQEIKYQKTGATDPTWKGTYTYDLVGMVRTFVDTTPLNHKYTYDEAYRLIEAEGASGDTTYKTSRYSYDKAGNRTSWGNELVSGTIYYRDSARYQMTVTQTFDDNNRGTRIDCTSGTATKTMSYVYEPNGNQRQESGDGSGNFKCPVSGFITNTDYDDANRLSHYENWTDADHHTNLDYGYDGDGNRLLQKYGYWVWNYTYEMDELKEADYTQYQYAGGKVLNERNVSGVPVWYVRDPYGNLLYTLHWRSSTLKPDVAVQDRLGSVRMIVTYSGTSTNKITYDAYGVITSPTTPTLRNSYEFTGLPRDTKSGYTFAQARYYSPALGRFLAQDTYKGNPWQPWTQNLYVYTGNNPVNYVDPTGHWREVLRNPYQAVALLFAVLAAGVQLHHPWPKYLGGPEKQPLIPLPTVDHQDLHKLMDKLVGSRGKRTSYYENLSPEEKAAIIDKLIDFYSNAKDLCPGCLEALLKELSKARKNPQGKVNAPQSEGEGASSGESSTTETSESTGDTSGPQWHDVPED